MPKGLENIALAFSEHQITHFGGLILLQRFCNHHLKLRKQFHDSINFHHREGTYQPYDLILFILYAIIIGMKRINRTEILQYNGAFLSLLGVDKYPDQSTLRRFLRCLTTSDIRHFARLHQKLRLSLFNQPGPRSSLIFDLDTVVLVVYGTQQGAKAVH